MPTRSRPTLPELIELFRKLDAPAPESWARCQYVEGIDQLSRFIFLRQAWTSVVPPEDTRWIEACIDNALPQADSPSAGVADALTRLLAAGAQRDDIHHVVRGMQYEVLVSLCYLLEDPGPLESVFDDLAWMLVRVNEDDEIVGTIDRLHESVLDVDPARRSRRPKT